MKSWTILMRTYKKEKAFVIFGVFFQVTNSFEDVQSYHDIVIFAGQGFTIISSH